MLGSTSQGKNPEKRGVPLAAYRFSAGLVTGADITVEADTKEEAEKKLKEGDWTEWESGYKPRDFEVQEGFELTEIDGESVE